MRIAKIFLLTVFILLVNLSSGIEFGLSPSEIEFSGETGNVLCINISVFSSIEGLKVNVYDKWAEINAQRNLDEYSLSADEAGIDSIYKNIFYTGREKQFEFCLSADKSGKYNGLVVFSPNEKSLEIGIWINANFYFENGENKITGFTGKEIFNAENFNIRKALLPLTFLNVALLGTLIFLLFRKKR